METAQAVAPQNEGRRRRRVIPIIDARFQWKYTLLITALGVGVSTIMGGLLYRAHLDNTRLLDLGDPSIQEQVIRGDQIFLLYLIATVAAMAVMLGLWGLVVTHRISGPLYLVARYLNEMASGVHPDLRPLRKNDELQAFFATFEDAVTGMRSRDGDMLEKVTGALADLSSGSESDRKDAEASLREIQENLKRALGQ